MEDENKKNQTDEFDEEKSKASKSKKTKKLQKAKKVGEWVRTADNLGHFAKEVIKIVGGGN